MPAVDAGLSLRDLGDALSTVVLEAGRLALEARDRGVSHWMKAGASPVTEADILVDVFLRERLCALDPDIGWLSEETRDDPARLSRRRVWIVDPIDGTRAFMAGLPDWTVSAALVEDGRPVLATLFAPVTDELFTAVHGGGAFHNRSPLAVADHDPSSPLRVAGPKPLVERLARHWPAPVAHEPKVHSLALRIARAAEGRLGVAFAAGDGRDWDLAAADLLMHEAGGRLTTLGGEGLAYNRPVPVHGALVAAPAACHAGIVGALAAGRA